MRTRPPARACPRDEYGDAVAPGHVSETTRETEFPRVEPPDLTRVRTRGARVIALCRVRRAGLKSARSNGENDRARPREGRVLCPP